MNCFSSEHKNSLRDNVSNTAKDMLNYFSVACKLGKITFCGFHYTFLVKGTFCVGIHILNISTKYMNCILLQSGPDHKANSLLLW